MGWLCHPNNAVRPRTGRPYLCSTVAAAGLLTLGEIAPTPPQNGRAHTMAYISEGLL